MKRIFAVCALLVCAGFVISTNAKSVPNDVQQNLIALDKQWGEAAGDSTKLDRIISDNLVAIGNNGESQDKQQLIAFDKSDSAGMQNTKYVADEYKFEMLSPDVVVMSHRATSTGTKDGKDVSESHRSLHVFNKHNGQWQVAANAQLPIAQ